MGRTTLLAAVIACAALFSVTTAQQRTPRAGALGPISLQQAGSGFVQPLGITHAGDGRLFVVEKGGRIRILNGGVTLAAPFLDISSLLPATPGDEEGLLGLAFHPDYPSTPYFFVHYVNANSDIVVARYSVSANPNLANAASGVVLLTVPHPGALNHNGGQLAFGGDGYLYIALGDGGGGGDPNNNGQNINTHLGKILRIDIDQNVGTPPYHGIPPTNPFAGATAGADEIWAYGLRNPWRFSFDTLTDDLLIADVGQGTREEINFEPAASPGGVNYGWRIMEGTTCHMNEPPGCGSPLLTGPVNNYDHSNGDCSVTGGYIYRGFSASYIGEYIFGDFCSGRIWHATPGGGTWPRILLLDSTFLISSFGQDVNGELYLADYVGGTIQRLLLEDSDGDAIMDQADNCPAASNPAQTNSDDNFIDQTPPLSQDDRTWVNSDAQGDACDSDDDNDGLADSAEPAGCNGSGALTATNRDTDGDLFLDGPECTLGTNPGSAASKPALTACGTTGDDDGDGLTNRVEVCHYGTNPAAANTDGDACGDGREVASVNGDAIVNSGDQGLMAAEMTRATPPPKLVNMDLNKDGLLNSGDQGLMGSKLGPCP